MCSSDVYFMCCKTITYNEVYNEVYEQLKLNKMRLNLKSKHQKEVVNLSNL